MVRRYYHLEEATSRFVQVSFFFDLRPNEPIHETELVNYLDDLPGLLMPGFGPLVHDSVLMDGRLSLVVGGRELLGPSHWFEFITRGFLGSLVCKGAEEFYNFGQRLSGVRFRPMGDLVRITVEKGNGAVESSVGVGLTDIVREWTLMYLRMSRIGALLGDMSSRDFVENSLGRFWCERHVELVGADLLDYTATAPLEELLINPVPNRFQR